MPLRQESVGRICSGVCHVLSARHPDPRARVSVSPAIFLDYIRIRQREKNCMLLGTEDPEVNNLQVIRGVVSPE